MKIFSLALSFFISAAAFAQGPSYYNAAATYNTATTFEQSFGTLPAPVDNGYITQNFGKYKIENGGPDIVGDNPGLTYGCQPGAAVHAVYNGEVAHVSSIGNTQCVIIRHGKYYTAYSNLATVNVRKGDALSQGQSIGTAATDDSNTSRGKVDFILINDGKNVNPRAWFKP